MMEIFLLSILVGKVGKKFELAMAVHSHHNLQKSLNKYFEDIEVLIFILVSKWYDTSDIFCKKDAKITSSV